MKTIMKTNRSLIDSNTNNSNQDTDNKTYKDNRTNLTMKDLTMMNLLNLWVVTIWVAYNNTNSIEMVEHSLLLKEFNISYQYKETDMKTKKTYKRESTITI